MSNDKNIAGNVLVFILIAIFLMGALTMVFVKSDGTSDDTGDHERASINASKILNEATQMENAVARLIMNGCSQSELSFWMDTNGDDLETAADTHYNAAAPTDKSCHVFDQRGGGIPVPRRDDSYNTARVLSVGTTEADLLFLVQYDTPDAERGLSREVCADINRRLNNDLDIDALPEANLTTFTFTGTYGGLTLGDNGAEIGMEGLKSACVVDNDCAGTDCNTFYRVILVR